MWSELNGVVGNNLFSHPYPRGSFVGYECHRHMSRCLPDWTPYAENLSGGN